VRAIVGAITSLAAFSISYGYLFVAMAPAVGLDAVPPSRWP